MALCRQYQISHSHFMGGPQRWTDLDRDKGLAYEMLLREQCPKCGTLAEDWVDEKGMPLEQPFLAAVGRHCQGCEEIERIEEKMPNKVKGSFVTVIPFSLLDDDDDEWYDPTRDPVALAEQKQRELDRARSLEG